MSALAERPSLFAGSQVEPVDGGGDGGTGGGPTLEDAISSVWEGLLTHAAVACPACPGTMRPQYGAISVAVGGRCADCGTTLR